MGQDNSAATAQISGGALFCAASMAGAPVRIEYATGRDDEGPFVNVLAVHLKGVRIPAHWLAEDAIADFERECEAAEITAEECAFGIPTEASTQTWRLAA